MKELNALRDSILKVSNQISRALERLGKICLISALTVMVLFAVSCAKKDVPLDQQTQVQVVAESMYIGFETLSRIIAINFPEYVDELEAISVEAERFVAGDIDLANFSTLAFNTLEEIDHRTKFMPQDLNVELLRTGVNVAIALIGTFDSMQFEKQIPPEIKLYVTKMAKGIQDGLESLPETEPEIKSLKI